MITPDVTVCLIWLLHSIWRATTQFRAVSCSSQTVNKRRYCIAMGYRRNARAAQEKVLSISGDGGFCSPRTNSRQLCVSNLIGSYDWIDGTTTWSPYRTPEVQTHIGYRFWTGGSSQVRGGIGASASELIIQTRSLLPCEKRSTSGPVLVGVHVTTNRM